MLKIWHSSGWIIFSFCLNMHLWVSVGLYVALSMLSLNQITSITSFLKGKQSVPGQNTIWPRSWDLGFRTWASVRLKPLSTGVGLSITVMGRLQPRFLGYSCQPWTWTSALQFFLHLYIGSCDTKPNLAHWQP